jgi:hypothetical protein
MAAIRSRSDTINLPLLASARPTPISHPSVADRGLAAFGKPPYLREMMLDLTDEETDALARLLSRTIDDDRYPLSPRIQVLKAILAKLRLEPVRERLAPPKVYAPPRAAAAKRRS